MVYGTDRVVGRVMWSKGCIAVSVSGRVVVVWMFLVCGPEFVECFENARDGITNSVVHNTIVA